jgi:hypothetical protein
MAGYSNTPLPKKLGIKAGSNFAVINAPPAFEKTLGKLPSDAAIHSRLSGKARFDVIVVFVTSRAELERQIAKTRGRMTPAAGLWIAWPKKSSRGCKRRHGRSSPRNRASHRPRRQQGVRHRRDLVGPQARDSLVVALAQLRIGQRAAAAMLGMSKFEPGSSNARRAASARPNRLLRLRRRSPAADASLPRAEVRVDRGSRSKGRPR